MKVQYQQENYCVGGMTPFFRQTQNKTRKNEEDLDFQDILPNVESVKEYIHHANFYIIKEK